MLKRKIAKHRLLRSSEARAHTNHVDFEPIYIETYRKARCHRISESFGRKPRFHVIVGLKGDRS